jgi:hypothetical protein
MYGNTGVLNTATPTALPITKNIQKIDTFGDSP